MHSSITTAQLLSSLGLAIEMSVKASSLEGSIVNRSAELALITGAGRLWLTGLGLGLAMSML
jgi:hypothetical protein